MDNKEKMEIHKNICIELNKIYEQKNNDYGDSIAKVREIIPHAILVRLHDKLNRLTTLMQDKAEQQVKSETIEDTLKDMANYCIAELIERCVDRHK